ncbi:uncharacterized protein LOC119586123 [Penaeus monodon]|uniref:uncharacterized protein LOC119586123 n=1 Tax=Penaeus monodon TaxID=6687 RepID=UPI0018A7D56F|nr:uncharacterized protein LOC119586123 [Penaeus monodon]XP_037790741.1 uncharacterized protein LOC119586123 [Penaeus monodon]XP_037790742.1 uncharacterized protein LOC119586123 [Penaeus monodon]
MKIYAVFVVWCFVLAPAEASSIKNREKRDGGVITAALIGAGAQVVTAGGGESSNTWELPSGVKVSAENCWQDGSGPCPNGNCLDRGRQGTVIKETTVSCRWFCVWRGHCKTQICCGA